MAHPELGRRILERVAERVAELATVESSPRQDGRNMTMVLNPTKKPKKPKAPKPAESEAGDTVAPEVAVEPAEAAG